MDCADLLRPIRSQFNRGIMAAMVFGWNGLAGVRFVDPWVKVNSAYWCEDMLTQCYWPGILANLPATNERYPFYADNGASHVSPCSPDLNMCDYYLWKAIQDRLQPRNGTRVELCADVLRQTYNLLLDEIRRCICSWPQRLLKCHMTGGRHFEG